MGFGKKKILAVDWDKNDLRMALVRAQGEGAELLKAVSVPIPPELSQDDAETFGAFLREAMRQSRINAKSTIMSVPRDQVVLNALHLPPTPDEELAALVQFQIVKELPFSAEQATIDFAVSSERDPALPCTALVAAIRNDDLTFYRDVAREAGLSLDRLGLRPYANLLAVLAGLPDSRERSMLIVEVGPQLTEIDIVQSGALTFSRAASVPLPDFKTTDDEKVKDSRITKISIQDIEPDARSKEIVGRLMVDVIRSFEAFRATDPSVSIDQVVVCGATGVEMELAESLAARFATKAVLYTPDRALDLTPQRAKELRGFSAALGLAMGEEQPQFETFDFLNPKKPISKQSLRMKKVPAAIMSAVMIIGSGYLFHSKFVRPAEEKAEKIRKSVAEKAQREKPIKKFTVRYDALHDWQRSEQVWPEVLLALTQVFPGEEKVFVSRIDFETRTRSKETIRTSTLKMKMQVSDLGMVNEIGKTLRQNNFKDVEEGQEIRLGSVSKDHLYQFDTSIKATLPLRPLPKKQTEESPEIEKEDIDPDKASSTLDTADTSSVSGGANPAQRGTEQTNPKDHATARGGHS